MEDIDIFDPQYVQKTRIAKLKAQAKVENDARLAAYLDRCKTWVAVNTQNRAVGAPISNAPTPPLYWVVTDDGQDYQRPWEGLAVPVLPAENQEPVKGAIAAPGVPSQLDQVLACLKVLNQKIDAIDGMLRGK